MNIDVAVGSGKATDMVHVTDVILSRLMGMKQEPTVHVSNSLYVILMLTFSLFDGDILH